MVKTDSILQLIGHTPMVRIQRLADPNGAELWAKVEYFNASGSVKDRIALRIIEEFERDGSLKPGGTVVEATSGNMGVGLAMVCAVRGYKSILVMFDKASDEKRRLAQAMGAEVIICPADVPADDPRSYYSVAKKIAEETPGAVLANQYHNPSNIQAHYDTTGPEIWEQTGGRIDAFVASIGTGGTITGAARYLKEKNPNIKVWAADPCGSILKAYKETGEITEGYLYLVEGIGEDMIPGALDIDMVDEIVSVSDKESFHTARQLARQEGIFGGGSTGTNMKVALDVAAAMHPDQVVVTIVPDTGERYLSKLYSDEWMRLKGMLSRELVTLRQLRQMKSQGLPNIVSAEPGLSVRGALDRMAQYNVSQLPVLDDHQNVGSLREGRLLALALEDSSALDRPVKEIMEEPFPTVEESTSVTHSVQLLLEHQGIVLSEDGEPVGFITRHDVINYTDAS
ncbi:MAG: pyridoxal-phosphate dependent enzyme [Fidelibacterota bacterium]|nr:MAG: pyridoxal-phosphate dependent enzyme [Candidatus Neomarinimicrobiota bacterium]